MSLEAVDRSHPLIYPDRLSEAITINDTHAAHNTDFIDIHTGGRADLEFDQKRRIVTLCRLATTANADPQDSGFYVKAIVCDAFGRYAVGGNKEIATHRVKSHHFFHSDGLPRFPHGLGRTKAYVHGEGASVDRYREEYGPDEALTDLGFNTSSPGNVAPCGDCREILQSNFNEDARAFEGTPNARIHIAHIRDFFFDDFRKSNGVRDYRVVEAALDSLTHSYNPYRKDGTPQLGVAFKMQDGQTISPRGFTNAGYYDVLPIAAGLSQIRGKTIEAVTPEFLVIATQSGVHIPYGQRQFVEEFGAGHDAFMRQTNASYSEIDIPIYIYEFNENGEIIGISATSRNEWLPKPFSAKDFGMDSQLATAFERAFLETRTTSRPSF